jgi:hypothetical protein
MSPIPIKMNDRKSYTVEEWWTNSQIELVKDSSRTWQKKRFTVVPGFWTLVNGMKVLSKLSQEKHLLEGEVPDNTAWEHEHCELCWTKISENENDQQEGYTDEEEWVCIQCYARYIAPTRQPI